jgi:hypothetical protein
MTSSLRQKIAGFLDRRCARGREPAGVRAMSRVSIRAPRRRGAGLLLVRRPGRAAVGDRLRLLGRPMRLEEGMDVAHRQGNPLFGFFPGEHAHFGVRREHRALHGDGVRVGRGIVRQHQNRGLAPTHEIPCHREDVQNRICSASRIVRGCCVERTWPNDGPNVVVWLFT